MKKLVVGLAVAVLLVLLSGAPERVTVEASDGSTPGVIDFLYIDMDPTGNGANGPLSSIETCKAVPIGGTISIDVVVDEVDAADLMQAFQVELNYTDTGPGAVKVTAVDTAGQMITANAGSLLTAVLIDPLPDADGTFRAAAVDVGPIPGSSESGEGVLARIYIEAVGPVGVSLLTLGAANTGVVAAQGPLAGIDIPETIWQMDPLVAVGDVNGDGSVDDSDCAISVTLDVSGNINGELFTASGLATVEPTSTPSLNTNTLTYSNIPTGWAIEIATITITIINTYKNTVHKGAVNLSTVTEGNFQGTRVHTFELWDGTDVGTITLTADVTKLSPTTYSAVLTITGTYSGPIDATGFSGYDMALHQAGPGEITGAFVQEVFTPGGVIKVLADTTYTYAGGGILPGDEISHLRVNDISLDGSTLSWTYEGWYELVVGGGGIAEPIVLGSDSAADTPGSSSARDYTAPIAAVAAAAVIALAAGGWYVRRRWMR